MVELKWPVTKCESCDYDFREVEPKASEKSNDANGKLKWSDFCPKCGHGYFVADRVEAKPTAEAQAVSDARPVLSYVEDATVKPSTPQENPDPEGLLTQTAVAVETNPNPEPEAIRPPGKGEYFCTQCSYNHRETTKVGKKHLKYREA